jgi:acyl carrier protein
LERKELEGRIIAAIGAALAIGERDVVAESFLVSASRVFSSYSLLELVLRLEEAFEIEIPDEHLDHDRFDTVRSLADYVESRLAESGAP